MSRSSNDRRKRNAEDRNYGYDDYDRDSNTKKWKKGRREASSIDSGTNTWTRPTYSRREIDEYFED